MPRALSPRTTSTASDRCSPATKRSTMGRSTGFSIAKRARPSCLARVSSRRLGIAAVGTIKQVHGMRDLDAVAALAHSIGELDLAAGVGDGEDAGPCRGQTIHTPL